MAEINQNGVYVNIAGAFHEITPFPGEDRPALQARVEAEVFTLVSECGVFRHTDPRNGVASFMRLVPGMAVQVVTGDILHKAAIEQKYAQQQGIPQIGRRQ